MVDTDYAINLLNEAIKTIKDQGLEPDNCLIAAFMNVYAIKDQTIALKNYTNKIHDCEISLDNLISIINNNINIDNIL